MSFDRLDRVTAHMREVTREEFFAAINPTNAHPSAEREASYWRLPDRTLQGVSTPGYMCADREGRYTDRKRWWLIR